MYTHAHPLLPAAVSALLASYCQVLWSLFRLLNVSPEQSDIDCDYDYSMAEAGAIVQSVIRGRDEDDDGRALGERMAHAVLDQCDSFIRRPFIFHAESTEPPERLSEEVLRARAAHSAQLPQCARCIPCTGHPPTGIAALCACAVQVWVQQRMV